MSIESVQKFYELIQNDTTLQERVKDAINSASVVQIASEKGYEFTEQELERAMQEAVIEGEISDEQLEAVAGGGKCSGNATYTKKNKTITEDNN